MLRILPYVIVLLAVFGFSRFMHLFNEGTGLVEVLNLHAAQDTKEEKKEDSNIAPSERKSPSVDKANTQVNISGLAKGESSASAPGNAPEEDENKYNDPAYSKYKSQVSCAASEQQLFAPSEVEILQNLRQKSKEIEAKEEELMIKESSLKAISQTLDTKLQALAKMQEQLTKIADQYEGDENNKVDRIVKVYENMKPKEAARIFNEMQITILLPVADRMKEQKLAAIIADMDPIKAKDLTTSIANKSRVLNLLNPESSQNQ